jgi:hypothetical protein
MRKLMLTVALLLAMAPLLAPATADSATLFDRCMATASCKQAVDAYAQQKVNAAISSCTTSFNTCSTNLATCSANLTTCQATTTPPPLQPTGLLYSTARLSWTNNAPTAIQFRVRCDPSPNPTTWAYQTVVTAPNTFTLISAVVPGPGTYTCQVDAETLDQQSPFSDPLTFAVLAGAATTRSIWTASDTPAEITHQDPQAVELGVKFRSDVTGSILGVRFYKGPSNTGPHTVNLYASGGALLASAAASNETASGWQTAQFAAAVPISANTTYIASYFTSTGMYSITYPYFTTAVVASPLRALADGEDGGNGVFKYGGGFPASTFQSANYWVDVLFIPQ